MQKTHHTTINKKHSLNIVLIAENIRTPENIGMIMRVAEAFGVEKIYFAGSESLDLSTKVKRASRNTYKTMDYEFCEEGTAPLQLLKKSGYSSLALEITKKSIALNNFKSFNEKLALVIGSERQGISGELLDLCEDHAHISMYGENSSINVVNALSIGLYEITK